MQRIRLRTVLAGLLPAMALTGSASAAVAILPAGSAVGSPARGPAPRVSTAAIAVAASRHYGPADNASGFSVIVATARGRAWAFGGTNPGGSSRPVAAQWNGSALTPAPMPAGLSGFLTDASARGPADIWAASRYGGYVLHWDGVHWSLSKRWAGREITGLTALAADDVWVFGTSVSGSPGTGTWHFDGRSWRPAAAGVAQHIYRASAVSRHDIWAITTGRHGDAVARYNGRAWRPVASDRVLARVSVSDILATSRRSVWVAGTQPGKGGAIRLVLAHWNGRHWARIPTRLRAWAGRLSRGPDHTVLLSATPAGAGTTGLILEASAAGWRPATLVTSSLGCGVSDLALTSGRKTVLAAGGVLTRLGGDAVIWAVPAEHAGTRPVDRTRHHTDPDDV